MSSLSVVAVGHQTQGSSGTVGLNAIVISVTTTADGTAVTDLLKANFQIVTAGVPLGGAEVELKSATRVGSGGYFYILILAPTSGTWKHGEYAIGIKVTSASGSDHGQTLTTLVID